MLGNRTRELPRRTHYLATHYLEYEHPDGTFKDSMFAYTFTQARDIARDTAFRTGRKVRVTALPKEDS
jgi:hypothetical protein